MIRDKLNTELGYQSLIDFKKDFIKEEIQDLKEIESRKLAGLPVDDDVISNISYSVMEEQKAIFIASYSLGKDINIVLNEYNLLLDYMEKGWNRDTGYVQMVWMLSCGIMLNIELDKFRRLVCLVEKEKAKDFLVDYLIRYYISSWEMSTSFFDDIPYKSILEIIQLADKNKLDSLQRIKKYLTKEWYRGHSDCGWYNDHKFGNIHYGYWSFESGALVKILGLDDSSLKDCPYYPYDMAHWLDNK